MSTKWAMTSSNAEKYVTGQINQKWQESGQVTRRRWHSLVGNGEEKEKI